MINFKMAPRIAIHNKVQLSLTNECACYSCVKVFFVSEIKEWTDNWDYRQKTESTKNEHTAVCPYCGVDAVLPINLEEDKDLINLQKIHDYWI